MEIQESLNKEVDLDLFVSLIDEFCHDVLTKKFGYKEAIKKYKFLKELGNDKHPWLIDAMFSHMIWAYDVHGERSGPSGYVYVAEYMCGKIKIGKTKNPKKRLAALSTMSSEPISRTFATGVLENRSKAESSLHKKFKHARAHGEFFAIPFEIAVTAAGNLSAIAGQITERRGQGKLHLTGVAK